MPAIHYLREDKTGLPRKSRSVISKKVPPRADNAVSAKFWRGYVRGLDIATFPSDAQTAEALIRAADAALYRAKSDGRDRVSAANRASTPAEAPIH